MKALFDLAGDSIVPFVTEALAELRNISLEYDETRGDATGAMNRDVNRLSQKIDPLMGLVLSALALLGGSVGVRPQEIASNFVSGIILLLVS